MHAREFSTRGKSLPICFFFFNAIEFKKGHREEEGPNNTDHCITEKKGKNERVWTKMVQKSSNPKEIFCSTGRVRKSKI